MKNNYYIRVGLCSINEKDINFPILHEIFNITIGNIEDYNEKFLDEDCIKIYNNLRRIIQNIQSHKT